MADSRKAVYQSDIAEILGLSQATVSLALKDDPRVSVLTREKVRSKAIELGYDPKASRLRNELRRQKRLKPKEQPAQGPRAMHVGQLQIARALGLSQSTVSEALRGRHIVSKKTRDLVVAKALELGYEPDPNLVALSSRRANKRIKKYLGTLAWVTCFDTQDGWNYAETFRRQRAGVADRAAKFGYKVEDFWLKDPSLSGEDASEVLRARGIRGLILAPQAKVGAELDLDCSHFAVVAFGTTLKKPVFHRVGNNVLSSSRLAYQKLKALGYEKISLAVARDVDGRVDNCFTAGYLSTKQMSGDDAFIPAFVYKTLEKEPFLRWFREWKPDAILSMGYAISVIQDWLRGEGFRMGEDIAIANLDWYDSQPGLAGIDQLTEVTGGAAVNVMHRLLRNSEFGVPKYHSRTLTTGVWRDGKSAPPRA